ncbi:PfaB family protein [Shewanella waksmanii]|uniref:PfaB family protein n=1 Tax=Shewanella waksmanii TaxID=213783 RepID=UPI0004ACFBB8|nr:PfaB family protein [Shewanella waksmanii]
MSTLVSNATHGQAADSVMPLRIALLALPSAQMSDEVLKHLLPDLSRSQLFDQPIVQIQVDDFEANLKATIDAISNDKVVQLTAQCCDTDAPISLLMMPALKAAQLRIHPHAQLAAMQQSALGSNAALSAALSQAKRDETDLSRNQDHHNLDSRQQFAVVYQLIVAMASRTWQRELVNGETPLSSKQAKSHYWYTEHHQARVAAISFTDDASSQAVSYVLSQGSGVLAAKSLLHAQQLQFVVQADDVSNLTAALGQLEQALIDEPLALLKLMRDNLAEAAQSTSQYRAVLQATGVDALKTEITALIQALPKVITADMHAAPYRTPAGSYFASTPLGSNKQQALAFVYPGVGTVYADMFSELHGYFPELFARLEREGNLKAMLQADAIYDLDPKTAANMALGDLAIAGVGSSYMLTQLLTQAFKIKPNFALGYSMGEASMWASLGVWQNPHALIAKTQTDPLFTSAISGDLTAVRAAWQLQNSDEAIDWNSFVVRCDKAAISALLPQYPRAYLAIVQGDTCVIAGCQTQCKALLSELGKRGIAANRVTAMHTTPALNEHSNVIDFYNQPLCDDVPNDIGFISAASLLSGQDKAVNEQQSLNSQIIAESIADTFCHPLDFTALIHSAQRQGAKLFVEIGADRQNCTLIDKIVKQDGGDASACCTVPMNAKGGTDTTHLLKALGQLISHQVPMSWQPLLDGLDREIALLKNQQQLADIAVANGITLPKGEVSCR